jgi:hypothetical protein
MQQSPSLEANSFSASQEISHILWQPKVHYRVQNSPSLLLVLSQINPAHVLASYLLKVHFNIIVPSAPMSSKWSVPRPPHQNSAGIFLLPIRATCPAYPIT